MLHHPNITTFYGVSSFDEQLLLVTEFVPHGLDRLVREFQLAHHRARTRTSAAPAGGPGIVTPPNPHARPHTHRPNWAGSPSQPSSAESQS